MNGKQSKGLRKMKATKEEIKAWKNLNHIQRGKFRKLYFGSDMVSVTEAIKNM